MSAINHNELVKQAQERDKREAQKKQAETDWPLQFKELEKRVEALEKHGKAAKK